MQQQQQQQPDAAKAAAGDEETSAGESNIVVVGSRRSGKTSLLREFMFKDKAGMLLASRNTFGSSQLDE